MSIFTGETEREDKKGPAVRTQPFGRVTLILYALGWDLL